MDEAFRAIRTEPMGLDLPTRRREPIKASCEAPGCGESTWFGKPYCEDHLDSLPYVREVKGRIEARDAEIALARRGRSNPANPDGLLAMEILVPLWVSGARTSKRLAIDAELEAPVAAACVRALAKSQLLRDMTVGSRRGAPRRVVLLTDLGRKAVEERLAGPASPMPEGRPGRIVTAARCSKCHSACLPSPTDLCRACRGLAPLRLDEPLELAPAPPPPEPARLSLPQPTKAGFSPVPPLLPNPDDHVTRQSPLSDHEGMIAGEGGRDMATATASQKRKKTSRLAGKLDELRETLETAIGEIKESLETVMDAMKVIRKEIVDGVDLDDFGAHELLSSKNGAKAVKAKIQKAETPKPTKKTASKREPPAVKPGGQFSAWLKKARAASDLSQPVFGENVGASRTQMFHWEKGTSAPGETMLCRIETFAKETCPAR